MAYIMKPIPKRKLDCRDLSYPGKKNNSLIVM